MLLCIPCQSSLSTKQVTPNCGLIFSVKNDRLGNFNLRIQFYQKSVFSYSVFASLEAHVFGYSHETLVLNECRWLPCLSCTETSFCGLQISWAYTVLHDSVRYCQYQYGVVVVVTGSRFIAVQRTPKEKHLGFVLSYYIKRQLCFDSFLPCCQFSLKFVLTWK